MVIAMISAMSNNVNGMGEIAATMTTPAGMIIAKTASAWKQSSLRCVYNLGHFLTGIVMMATISNNATGMEGTAVTMRGLIGTDTAMIVNA